jgi:quinolinate synthase
LTDVSTILKNIAEWKIKRNALILAHSYQPEEVQEIADFVGDSLALSQKSASTAHDVIVFCGVHFMAESAAILSPDKTVLLPALDAGCPLADFANSQQVREWREKYPNAAVVAYINSSAEVKAEVDICCTSSNALRVIESLPNKEIIFLPDGNLGHYVASHFPDRQFHLWPGHCITHHRIEPKEVEVVRKNHPEAEILVHPECRPDVIAMADFVGSTAQILARVENSPSQTFIIGTEMGVIPGLRKNHPEKKFYLLSSGLVCPNMKRTTLDKVLTSLLNMEHQITVPEPLRSRARRCLDRMLQVG